MYLCKKVQIIFGFDDDKCKANNALHFFYLYTLEYIASEFLYMYTLL